MRASVSEWIDHPENLLKCNGYVVIVDDGQALSTYGPFIAPEAALDFLSKVGDSNYDITIQPLCTLKDVTASFFVLSERNTGHVN